MILVHAGVYELNNVGTDGCQEYSGEGGGGGLLSGEGEDGKDRAGGHFEVLVSAFLRCGSVGVYFRTVG